MDVKQLAESVESLSNKNALILFLSKNRKLDIERKKLLDQNEDVFHAISRASRIGKALEDPTCDINGPAGMRIVAQAIQDLSDHYLGK